MTSGVHSQKPPSSKPLKPICLARTTSLTVSSCLLHLLQVEYPGLAISFVPPRPLPFFVVFDQCCWLLYCCWLPSRALLSSLLLSCCMQSYCEALRAQTRRGALEVLFIIIITVVLPQIFFNLTTLFSYPVFFSLFHAPHDVVHFLVFLRSFRFESFCSQFSPFVAQIKNFYSDPRFFSSDDVF